MNIKLLRFCCIFLATTLGLDVAGPQGYIVGIVWLFSGCLLAVWSLHWGKDND